MRLFSEKHRPLHLGPPAWERAPRHSELPDLTAIADDPVVAFHRPDAPQSIVNAMGEYQSMMDVLRVGIPNPQVATCPDDPQERARHLKAFGYFCDATIVGICRLPAAARRAQPRVNPDTAPLMAALQTRQTATLAAGIDTIMADLRDSTAQAVLPPAAHSFALVLLYAWPRELCRDEPGAAWLEQAHNARACLRASESASVLSEYLRVLGYDARAHSATASDVYLGRLATAAGLTLWHAGRLSAPAVGTRFGLAAVTTDFAMAVDQPLAPRRARRTPARFAAMAQKAKQTIGAYLSRDPFARRRFVDGPHPFERLPRARTPTTDIDEPAIARIPKRADMFTRAQFGDMGVQVQNATRNGYYVRKTAPSAAQRRVLGAFVLLQDAPPCSIMETESGVTTADPARNAENIKAACYFLGIDAVGISRCPEWVWYSHNALGEPITPRHNNAISMIIDQGYQTMDGASGDDWISVAQSMRAYLRFSLLGGVIANQIRRLGFEARVHSVMDGEVLQPPLLLLSGLGEGQPHWRGHFEPVSGPAVEIRCGHHNDASGA